MAQITLDEFIRDYTGKPVDFDHYFGTQCMDLMHFYVYDVLGLTDRHTLSQPEARLLFQNFQNVPGHENFELIANTPDNVPQPGDIVVWGEPMGQYMDATGNIRFAGHTGIFIEGDVNRFRSFDANFNEKLPHVQEHDYHAVIGWLRFKGTVPQSQMISDVQQALQSQIGLTDSCQSQLKTALEQANNLMLQLDVANKELGEVKSKYEQEHKENIALNKTIESMAGENKDYSQEAYEAQHKADELQQGIHRIAEETGITNQVDDKQLVEEVLAKVRKVTQEQQLNTIPEVHYFREIFGLLKRKNIDIYLDRIKMGPIQDNDPQVLEKLLRFLNDTFSELVTVTEKVQAPTEEPLPVAASVKKRNPIKGFLALFFQ